ncbi:hypothetical protein STCU_10865 [Strigomonas culicis]|uniref:Uncharacterized protein n=1 Tax=Strigomonas culicis TaxID=28005 RepID=S9TJH9_9TRYP|nr:hypothetical protein STCU_10865 [Strigomonas culicis]|eukprot:EPY16999.1 hypothetical protein STCU_10865 [Strigomonas culicis]
MVVTVRIRPFTFREVNEHLQSIFMQRKRKLQNQNGQQQDHNSTMRSVNKGRQPFGPGYDELNRTMNTNDGHTKSTPEDDDGKGGASAGRRKMLNPNGTINQRLMHEILSDDEEEDDLKAAARHGRGEWQLDRRAVRVARRKGVEGLVSLRPCLLLLCAQHPAGGSRRAQHDPAGAGDGRDRHLRRQRCVLLQK